MHAEIKGMSHPGLIRPRNEDCWYGSEAQRLAVVADGMGGEACGEVASQVTVETIREAFSAFPATSPRECLERAVREAHWRVLRDVRSAGSCQGMGSTVVAAAWEGSQVEIASVGDSRAYLLRGGLLRQLTRDQNLGNAMRDRMGWSDEEVERFPQRHVLTSAIGVGEEVEIGRIGLTAEAGDLILLCSDGLSGPAGDLVIESILNSSLPLGDKVAELIEAAKEQGGPDNITAVLIRFNENEPE